MTYVLVNSSDFMVSCCGVSCLNLNRESDIVLLCHESDAVGFPNIWHLTFTKLNEGNFVQL